MVASVFWAFHNLSKIEKFYRGSGSPHGLWSESGHVVRWGNIAFSGVWLVDNNRFPIFKTAIWYTYASYVYITLQMLL